MAVIGSVLPEVLLGTSNCVIKQDSYIGSWCSEIANGDNVTKEPDLYNLTPVITVGVPDPDLLDGLTAIDRLVDEEEWTSEVIELVYETRITSSDDDDDDDCSVCLTPEDLSDMFDDDSSSLSSSSSNIGLDHSTIEWERLDDLKSQSSSQNGETLPDLSRLINGSTSVDKTVCISNKETYHCRLSEKSDEHIPCKSKRGAKNVLLWKFLLNLLDTRTDLVQWVDLHQGTFKFVDTSSVSKMWGSEKKKTSRMNFEKLSRGIRHYYKTGLMSRISGQRLIYKFNWEKVPKKYRKC